VLSYLDRLCRALAARDPGAIRALLADPMAGTLPAAVRAEAEALARDPLREARAPLQAFVFAHRMAQLMAAVRPPAAASANAPRSAATVEGAPAPPRASRRVTPRRATAA
jgi:hypothetical protein